VASLRQLPPDDPTSLALIAELDAELGRQTPREHMHGLHAGEEHDPRLRFFVVEEQGESIGCGALRVLEPGVAELKRMFVRRPFRGRGFGRQLLEQLERRAQDAGIHTLRLETGWMLEDALALYRAAGYTEIPLYGEYIGSPYSLCMEKRFAPSRRKRR